MVKSKILDMGEHLIPPNSNAETAALVTLPDGSQDTVELFGGTSSYGYWGMGSMGQRTEATYEFRTGQHATLVIDTDDITLDIDPMLDAFDYGDGPSRPDALFLLSEVTSMTDLDDRLNAYALNCLIGATRADHTVDA